MTANPVSFSLARTAFGSALAALLFLLAALIPLAATLYLWHLARQHLHLRALSLSVAIASALLSTLLLAIAMRQLDRVLTTHSPRWLLRLTLKLNKRLLLVLQLLTTSLALASAYLLVFNYKIPAF